MAASLGTTVARPNEQSNGYSGSQTNNGNSLLACGLVVYETAAQTPAMTWNAQAMAGETQYKDGANHSSAQWFLKTSPATGANTLAVTGLSSDRQGIFYAPINGATDTLRDSDGTTGTGVTSLSRTVTSVAGDLILGVLAIADAQTDPTVVGTGDFVTAEVSEGLCPDFLRQVCYAFVATGVSHTVGASWTGSKNASFAVIVLTAAATGPTIDTQPTAGTLVVNAIAAFTTKVFTVAATTSGGTLLYDWELETGVGTGVYANVATGSGVTWSGGTTASATAVATASTLSGRRVRCNVSDDNGTTTTTAVALTIYDGPEGSASSGTSNGSGLAVTTEDCDVPMDVFLQGAVIRYTDTVQGQTLSGSGVSVAP